MHIKGCFETRKVYVDGGELDPKYSQRVYNYSPDGFDWGYDGSAQFALALLLTVCSSRVAVALHQKFKLDFVACLPRGDFETELDLNYWVVHIGGVKACKLHPDRPALDRTPYCKECHRQHCREYHKAHTHRGSQG